MELGEIIFIEIGIKLMKLIDKVAVITGGSRGIGRALAKSYLVEGAKVSIAARTISELELSVEELKDLGMDCVIAIPGDVAKRENVKNIVNKTMNCYGKIDILVNAAGVQSPIGTLIDIDAHEWANNININLIGTLLCCKYVLPYMISRKKGKIINFSGGGAVSPRPNFSAYACAKAGIVRLTETLANEVKDYAIDVNAIAPGAVNTKMLEEIIDAGDKSGKDELLEAKNRKRTGGNSPQIAADLAVFLASDDSDGITGKLISAVWDPWRNEDFKEKLKADSDFAVLRRIDDMTFYKKAY